MNRRPFVERTIGAIAAAVLAPAAVAPAILPRQQFFGGSYGRVLPRVIHASTPYGPQTWVPWRFVNGSSIAFRRTEPDETDAGVWFDEIVAGDGALELKRLGEPIRPGGPWDADDDGRAGRADVARVRRAVDPGRRQRGRR